MTSLSRIARMLIAGEFALAAAIIVYAGFHDIPGVFVGAPAGLPVHFEAKCHAIESESHCHVTVTELSAGRFRLATDTAAETLTISVDSPRAIETARHLLVSVAQSTKLQLLGESHGASGVSPTASGTPATDPIQLSGAPRRTVVPLPRGAAITALSFSSESDALTPMVVVEFGLFEHDRGLLSDVRPLFPAIPPQRYHSTLVPRAIGRLCLFTMLAAFAVPAVALKKVNPVLLAAACFSLCVLDLASLYSPYTARDLRAFYASGPLQEGAGSNLNGAIWEASRLLDGHGFTVADGLVSWAKMPGYGLLAAVAGLLFGHRTLVDVAIATAFLQVLFYSCSLGFFAWAAGRLWRPPVVWTLGLLIAMLPKQLGYTQVDSVIAPIALVILGALCIRLDAHQQGRPVSLRVDAFVHLTFALWFLMRPDVLPGWAVVSLILHARSPRRLLIPAALVAVIGVGWAGYKMRYTGEFVPTTSTTGASLLCGLWEVPSRFPWTCSDESYFAWVSSHTAFDPKSQAGSNVVVREVVKFWLTFPGHFVFMVYNKLMRCLSGDLWPGIPTDLQQSLFQIVGRGPLVLFFVTVIALAVGAGYQRLRTLLLAWPLFLNAPLFWIMQTSEGRYYGAVGVALLVGAVPLLFEKPFYDAIRSRHRATVAVLVCVGVLATTAWPIHDWLLRNDTFHYWTPFLDPSASSWGVVR
jgi:hypothetical protein